MERTYFRLLDNLDIGDRWQLGSIRFENPRVEDDDPRLLTGAPVRPHPLVVDVHREGRPLEFSLTGVAEPVASGRLAVAIEGAAGQDLQRLPVRIEGTRSDMPFEALNAVRTVDCLDETRSEFIKWTKKDHRADLAGQYRQVTKLRVDRTQVPSDAHFFRIKGWKIALIVSDAVRTRMLANGCEGAEFRSV